MGESRFTERPTRREGVVKATPFTAKKVTASRRQHRPGRPAKIDENAELRAFIHARIRPQNSNRIGLGNSTVARDQSKDIRNKRLVTTQSCDIKVCSCWTPGEVVASGGGGSRRRAKILKMIEAEGTLL